MIVGLENEQSHIHWYGVGAVCQINNNMDDLNVVVGQIQLDYDPGDRIKEMKSELRNK